MSKSLCALAVLALLAAGAWRTRRWLPFRARSKRCSHYDDAPFSIEPRIGALRVKGTRLVLRRAMPKEEFLDSDLYPHTTKSKQFALEGGSGQGFLLILNDPVFHNVHLWLNFENDRLGKVDFGWGRQITTAEWTNELVEARISRYRTFLVQQLGPIRSFPSEFPWGKIFAARDDKGGAPAMAIRYHGFEFRPPIIRELELS